MGGLARTSRAMILKHSLNQQAAQWGRIAMTTRSVQHGRFTIERRYDAPPARVFAAWTEPEARRRWAVPGTNWALAEPQFDFRVGGHETARFGDPGDPLYCSRTAYLDIAQDQRIVFTYTVDRGDIRISASLMTVQLQPNGAGTRLILTEMAAYLDGGDQPEIRRQGWDSMLDKLGPALD
jgi:uncharacterized protein YndB with AHSA1/START domain